MDSPADASSAHPSGYLRLDGPEGQTEAKSSQVRSCAVWGQAGSRPESGRQPGPVVLRTPPYAAVCPSCGSERRVWKPPTSRFRPRVCGPCNLRAQHVAVAHLMGKKGRA